MIYVKRKPFLLQLFFYFYTFDALVTFIFFLQSGNNFNTYVSHMFTGFTIFFLTISFVILLTNQLTLYPLRWLFTLLSTFILFEPVVQMFILADALKYIDIFEYQMHVPKIPSFVDIPTTSYLQVFATIKLSTAILLYFFLHRQQAITKWGQFNDLVFVSPTILGGIIKSCLLLLFLFFAFASSSQILFKQFVSNASAGFLEVRGNELISVAKYYRHAERSNIIYLVPMMHIAQSNFYTQVLAENYPANTVALAEGVSDKKNLFKSNTDYGALAKIFDLTSQTEAFDLKKAGIKPIPADVDASTFDKTTIEELNKTFSYNIFDLSFEDLLATQEQDPDTFTNILYHLKTDLIDKRNDYLLKKLKKSQDRYDNIMIPWGALHMRGFEEAITNDGYQIFDQRNYILANIREITMKVVRELGK